MNVITAATSRTSEYGVRDSERVGLQKRRILCASDLTRRSVPAIRTAALFANRLDAELNLLHVIPTRRDIGVHRSAEEKLRGQLSESPLQTSAASALVIRAGDPEKTIAQVASEIDPGLIVLGEQRKRVLAPLLGTTAERVASLTQCPVLVVRTQGTVGYESVIVATDLKPSFRDMIRFADRWSFLAAPRVSILHAFQSPYQGPLYAEGYDIEAATRALAGWKQSAREYLLKKLNEAEVNGDRFEMHINESRPLRLVRRALRSGAPSLLILGASEHTVLSRLARGSLKNDALLSLDCDVLIAPGPTHRAEFFFDSRRAA